MSEYLNLMKDLIDKRNINTKKVNKEILQLYKNMYYDYRKELTKVKPGSLREFWLKDQMKALGNSMKEIALQEKNLITKEMEAIIKATTKANEDYLNIAASKAGLPKDLFTGTFSKMNTDILRELVAGGLYKDGKGLSKRIWNDAKQFNKDIDHVIKEGLSKKKSVYDIAKDLEKYVNPDQKKDYEWKRLYPNAGKKVIDYNAYRLANTSITHAYQTALARVNKINPFMEGIQWVGGNHARSCELCKERNGKIYGAKISKGNYTTDPLPLDHPNGFCNNIPVVEDLDKVADRLKDWFEGKPNKELDKWFKEHGSKYGGLEDIKPKKPKKDTIKEVKKFINMSHEEGVSHFKSWTDSLTVEDKKEFRRYTTSYYRVINKALREGKKLTASQQRLYDHMTGALKRSELKENIIVHRGSGIDAFGIGLGRGAMAKEGINIEDVKKKLLGTVFEDKGFMSTSLIEGKNFKSDVKMTINVPAGKGVGAYIQPISAVSSEYEYLLPPGSKLIIKEIKEATAYDTVLEKEYKYIDMVLEVIK